jgi:hypothetical protein
MMGSEKFSSDVAEIWADLRTEASKGLKESEAAAAH